MLKIGEIGGNGVYWMRLLMTSVELRQKSGMSKNTSHTPPLAFQPRAIQAEDHSLDQP